MAYIKQMFKTHPVNPSSDHPTDIEWITACYACAEACNVCADVWLATARIISRFTRTDFKLAGAQLHASIQSCENCGAECEKHDTRMAHCRGCAEACRRCANACRALLAEKPGE